MTRRERCMSRWNRITIVDTNRYIVNSFLLDRLGQLNCKIKTQNRRRIHEVKRSKKPNNIQLELQEQQENDEEKNDFSFKDFDESTDVEKSCNVTSFLAFDEKPDLIESLQFHDAEDILDLDS